MLNKYHVEAMHDWLLNYHDTEIDYDETSVIEEDTEIRETKIEYKEITLSEEVDGINRMDSNIYMTVILLWMINFV